VILSASAELLVHLVHVVSPDPQFDATIIQRLRTREFFERAL
jgi:hypothetical protein